MSRKGDSVDEPGVHSLSYFVANPFQRDDADDLCDLCTSAASKAGSSARFKASIRQHEVGQLSGFRIVELIYEFAARDDSPPPFKVRWKSILVQRKPDQFAEILHLQTSYFERELTPATIVLSGREQILVSQDSDGGNGGGCWEAYWWFDSAGPHPLDFSRLKSKIEQQIPPQATFKIACDAIDLQQQRVVSTVQKKDPACHVCGSLGEVTAHFHLRKNIALPGEINFAKSPDSFSLQK